MYAVSPPPFGPLQKTPKAARAAYAMLLGIWSVVLLYVCVVPMVCAQEPTSGKPNSWWDGSPWDNPDRGFWWYPDPKQDEPPEPEKPKEEKKKTIYEMTDLEEIKKEVDRLKGIAVTNPTEKNVLEFLEAQNWIMDKSSLFADVSRRVVWANPQVNYALRSPVVNYAKNRMTERVKAQRAENIKNLSETHAILFFARSDCDFCKDQAPILKSFVEHTGMRVLTISLDGGPIPEFPDARPDNGVSAYISGGEGINYVPALFLLERESKQAIPLGSGVVAREELAERIRVMTLTEPGQEF
jgi:conjugal transfer pilus assembly protein TraF